MVLSKLYDLNVQKNDFITSDKILNFIEIINTNHISYIKTDFIKRRHNGLVNINNWRNINKIINLNNINVLISGHSDYSVDITELDILNNSNLKYWFCQNKNIRHHKLFSVPIGITNYYEPNSVVHKIIGNTDVIYEISKTPKNLKNLVYLNITYRNYPQERIQVLQLYKDKKWVTYDQPDISINGHYNFLKNVYEHKFVFAPRGNGIDTHRIWESL